MISLLLARLSCWCLAGEMLGWSRLPSFVSTWRNLPAAATRCQHAASLPGAWDCGLVKRVTSWATRPLGPLCQRQTGHVHRPIKVLRKKVHWKSDWHYNVISFRRKDRLVGLTLDHIWQMKSIFNLHQIFSYYQYSYSSAFKLILIKRHIGWQWCDYTRSW